MAGIIIEGWTWDDANIAELAAHGVTPRVVLQVAAEAPRFRRNKRSRAATHQMVGPDRGGTCWTICIGPVPGEHGAWRAITGWRSELHEIAWHRGTKR